MRISVKVRRGMTRRGEGVPCIRACLTRMVGWSSGRKSSVEESLAMLGCGEGHRERVAGSGRDMLSVVRVEFMMRNAAEGASGNCEQAASPSRASGAARDRCRGFFRYESLASMGKAIVDEDIFRAVRNGSVSSSPGCFP